MNFFPRNARLPGLLAFSVLASSPAGAFPAYPAMWGQAGDGFCDIQTPQWEEDSDRAHETPPLDVIAEGVQIKMSNASLLDLRYPEDVHQEKMDARNRMLPEMNRFYDRAFEVIQESLDIAAGKCISPRSIQVGREEVSRMPGLVKFKLSGRVVAPFQLRAFARMFPGEYEFKTDCSVDVRRRPGHGKHPTYGLLYPELNCKTVAKPVKKVEKSVAQAEVCRRLRACGQMASKTDLETSWIDEQKMNWECY